MGRRRTRLQCGHANYLALRFLKSCDAATQHLDGELLRRSFCGALLERAV